MNHSYATRRQAGAALIVSLVMLLVLTLLGVTAMQSTTVEERLSGNLRDRNQAFQSAEAALREAERLVISRPDLFNNPDPTDGIFVRRILEGEQVADPAMPDALDDASWESDVLRLGESAAGLDGTPGLSDGSARFRIEKQPAFDAAPGGIGEPVPDEQQGNPGNYRLQSRSRGGSGLTDVILEAEIRR